MRGIPLDRKAKPAAVVVSAAASLAGAASAVGPGPGLAPSASLPRPVTPGTRQRVPEA